MQWRQTVHNTDRTKRCNMTGINVVYIFYMYIFIKIINCNNNTNTYSKSHDHSTRSLAFLLSVSSFFFFFFLLLFCVCFYFYFSLFLYIFFLDSFVRRVSVSHRSLIFNLTSHILNTIYMVHCRWAGRQVASQSVQAKVTEVTTSRKHRAFSCCCCRYYFIKIALSLSRCTVALLRRCSRAHIHSRRCCNCQYWNYPRQNKLAA